MNELLNANPVGKAAVVLRLAMVPAVISAAAAVASAARIATATGIAAGIAATTATVKWIATARTALETRTENYSITSHGLISPLKGSKFTCLLHFITHGLVLIQF